MTAVALPERLVRGRLDFAVVTAPNRRTLELTVERDASLTVRAPAGATVEQVERLIDAKADWLHRKLVEKRALGGPAVTKQLVDGEGFAYLGRTHRLRLTDGSDGADSAWSSVRLDGGRLQMPRVVADDPAAAVAALRGWYRRVGTSWLRRRVEPWADRMGVEGTEVHVADLGFRWGSTRGPGQVSVHWATLQHRPRLIDYVLVHELAHLDVSGHGPEFWRLVTRALPDQSQRRDELAQVGAGTWLGDIAPLP